MSRPPASSAFPACPVVVPHVEVVLSDDEARGRRLSRWLLARPSAVLHLRLLPRVRPRVPHPFQLYSPPSTPRSPRFPPTSHPLSLHEGCRPSPPRLPPPSTRTPPSAGFIRKTFNMVSDPSTLDIVSWDDSGERFTVHLAARTKPTDLC